MSASRSIALVSTLYPPHVVGGAELVVEHLARGLVGHGWRVTVIALTGGRDRPSVTERDGVLVRRIAVRQLYDAFSDRPDRRRQLWQRALWHLLDIRNPWSIGPVQDAIREDRPDLIHTHNLAGLSPAIWSVAARAGIPLIHTAHDYHLLCPRSTLVRSDGSMCEAAPIPCLAYRGAMTHHELAFFTAPSEHVLNKHRDLGARAREWVVIRNGVRLVPPRPSRAALPRRFLYLGQLTEHKGLPVLLRAVESLPPDADLEVHIAGAGPMAELVQRVAAADPRVRFHGFVTGSAKEELLAASDVLLLPSQWQENAPLAVLEALASGMPVIASDIGGLGEIVEDGVNGLLVGAGEPRGLALAMERILGDEALMRVLQAGALALRPQVSSERMVADYMALYARATA